MKLEKHIQKAFEAAPDIGAATTLYFSLRGALDAGLRAKKVLLARPVGRPRSSAPRSVGRPKSVVPHFTLLDISLVQRTMGGSIEEQDCTDDPLTVAALADLALPLTAWARRRCPYADASAWPAEIARGLGRFAFELPKNGRAGTFEFSLPGQAWLQARIVRSDAAVQEPYGEYTESLPSPQEQQKC
jgi:hypothetical protein